MSRWREIDGAGGEGGIVARTRDTDLLARLEILRDRGLQGLVRDSDFFLERVELRIVIDLPPLALSAASLGCACFQVPLGGLGGGSSLKAGAAGGVAGRW